MSRRSDGGFGDETLHSRFEHIAETNPDQLAVAAGGGMLTCVPRNSGVLEACAG